MPYTHADEILSQFIPGQKNAGAVQAQQQGISLPRQPASDLLTLKSQLSKGVINRQQFITKMASLSPKQPGKYSLGNIAGAFGSAAVALPKNLAVSTAKSAAQGIVGTSNFAYKGVAPALNLPKNNFQQATNSTPLGRKLGNFAGTPNTRQTIAGLASTALLAAGGEAATAKAAVAKNVGIGAGFGAASAESGAKAPTKKELAKSTVAGALFGGGATALGRALTRVQTQRAAGINVPKSALDNHIVEDKGGPLPSPNKSPEIKSTPVTQNKSQIESGKGSVQNTNDRDQVAKSYFSNTDKATKDYQAHVMNEFGTSHPNVVSADSAKFIVRGEEKMNPADAGPFHEHASQFAKDYYKKLLANPATKDRPVLITGGGAGAGKTSGLALLKKENKSLDDYAAINDTNLTSLKSATDRIDPALESGRRVNLLYTYRHPVEALVNGQIPRAERTGRIVPIEQHIETHLGSLDTIKQVIEKYKDNPNVSIKIVDNSRGKGMQAFTGLDFLKDKVYDKSNLKKELENELQKAKDAGHLTEEAFHAYHGDRELGRSNNPESKKQDSKDNQTGRVERTDSGLGQPNQKVAKAASDIQSRAIEKKLASSEGFDELAGYNPKTHKEEAQKAATLISSDPERALRIAKGDESLPSGINGAKLLIGLEEHAHLNNKPELLPELAKSPLASERSVHAQELSLSRNTNPDSPLAKVQEVLKARQDAAKGKLKGQTIEKATASVASDIAKEVKARTPKTSRQDWHSFVNELRCK